MSVSHHLDALAAYGAATVRVVPVEGEPEDQLASGGQLATRFETLGRRPLIEVLADPRVALVRLEDGDLRVQLARSEGTARLVVGWGEVTVIDEEVEAPRVRPPGKGPWFRPDPATEVDDVRTALHDQGRALFAVSDRGQLRWFTGGLHGGGVGQRWLRASIPSVFPEDLGSAAFREAHGVRFAYVAGAMAGGIASADLVLAMARAGLLAFFGAGGLPIEAVEAAIARIAAEVPPGAAWGANLLHNPQEPSVEEQTVDLYLKHGVQRVSASAYMTLTPAIVRYRLTGIRKEGDRVVCPNRVFAKVSRHEVAERFLRPAPEAIVADLVKAGVLTAEQAELARSVPVATDITAEADSGGHTDRRPLPVLLPVLQALRDAVHAEEGYAEHPRVGAAGGLGTPNAVWGAFAMGADYVLTGSVNQSSLEAGTSERAKQMLAEAAFTDVTTGPAPDMFEIGAHVQVLGRGTMYASRSQRLYDLYRSYPSMEEIPDKDRKRIERQIFGSPLDKVWEGTRMYWLQRDPEQVKRADEDPRHKMALTFRWYLGMTSRWARMGTDNRKRDFQIWCGPSMGGFNSWVKDGPLEALEHRSVVAIADALMDGAAALARVSMARSSGVPLPAGVDRV